MLLKDTEHPHLRWVCSAVALSCVASLPIFPDHHPVCGLCDKYIWADKHTSRVMKPLPTLLDTRENGRKAGKPSIAESRPPLFALFTITLRTPLSYAPVPIHLSLWVLSRSHDYKNRSATALTAHIIHLSLS